MNSSAVLKEKAPKPTLSFLSAEIASLRERVEDLEDLRELNSAISRNRGKKLIPWDEAKKDLGLT